jgi:hypothetical protein
MTSAHEYDADTAIDALTEDSPMAPQPPRREGREPLKAHQLTLLHRCRLFEGGAMPMSLFPSLPAGVATPRSYIRTHIGVLADRVGSGKSRVMLALMATGAPGAAEGAAECAAEGAADSGDGGDGSPHYRLHTYGGNKVTLFTQERTRRIRTNLLVIPHNLMAQWDTYAREYSDVLRYCQVNSRQRVEDVCAAGIETFDLVIVTGTYYSSLAAVLNTRALKLRRLVFDEVDNINMANSVAVDACFCWFVTASYGNLMYPAGWRGWDARLSASVQRAVGLKQPGFARSLFMDLAGTMSREYMRALVIKNTDAFVLRSIELPDPVSTFVRCRTPAAVSVLHGVVDRMILERLNAGDVASAILCVDKDHRCASEDNIVTAVVQKYVRRLHNIDCQLELSSRWFASEAESASEISRLRRERAEAAHRIECIQTRVRESATCCICLDDIKHKTVTRCCNSAFCFRCIHTWLARQGVCPLCKDPVSPHDLLVIDARVEEGDGDPRDVAATEPTCGSDAPGPRHDKLRNLELILRGAAQDAGPKSTLVFSAHAETFTGVIEVLDRLGLRYAFLKGNHNVVNSIVKRYKDGSIPVLLVNVNHYGSGLNLENTTDVVMFHKLDSELEKQVVGRAHRLGRDAPLRVWYLLHDNEVGLPPAP